MKEIKLHDSILLEIQDLQTRNSESLFNLGRISLILAQAEKEMEIMEEEYQKKIKEASEIQEEQRLISERIISEYGEGDLDISTGIYRVR
jgi:hypothetical protein